MLKIWEVLFMLSLGIVLAACTSPQETSSISYESDYISLNWWLEADEVIAYQTAMTVFDDTTSQISFDVDQLLEGIVDDNQISELISNLSFPDSTDLVTILRRNSNNNIGIEMILDSVTFAEPDLGEEALNNSFNEFMESLVGTVQLRGELTPEGAIASFYNEQRQRNLVALFFELPTRPVRVGDTWEIDVNCIYMGSGFIATRAERINRVELVEMGQTPEGETIATIDYVILEAVEGLFETPQSDEPIHSSATCSYLGRGEFLVNQGRWHQLNGELAITSTGIMSTSSAQHITLIPMETVPEQYRDLR